MITETCTPSLPFTHFYFHLAGLIALLDDPSTEIRVHAVRVLNDIVSWGWPEISDAVAKMYAIHNFLISSEAMAQDTSFAQHHLAALLVSKV